MGSAALLGLTDVDALLYSLTKLSGGNLTTAVAERALAVGVLANTLLKLGLAAVVGRSVFRQWVVGGLPSHGHRDRRPAADLLRDQAAALTGAGIPLRADPLRYRRRLLLYERPETILA